MASKVVIDDAIGEGHQYMYAIMDDWSDPESGPAIEATLKIHDGKNVCFFHLMAYDDDGFQETQDFLSRLQDNINVVYRELQMAYLDAKIGEAYAHTKAKEQQEGESPPEEDREV